MDENTPGVSLDRLRRGRSAETSDRPDRTSRLCSATPAAEQRDFVKLSLLKKAWFIICGTIWGGLCLYGVFLLWKEQATWIIDHLLAWLAL